MKKRDLCLFFIFLMVGVLLFSVFVGAHGDEIEGEMNHGMASSKWADPFFYIKLTSLYLGIIVIGLLFWGRGLSCNAQRLVFWIMILPIVFATLYLAGFTVYENVSSITHGPVHWHADYEVWMCGERIKLIDPEGLNNRIGNPLLHEHNDDRMHVEGTVTDMSTITLAEFFESVGGELHDDHFSYPSTNGMMSYKNDDACPDGSRGSLKVYVNGKRLDNVEEYVIYPASLAPPGDCIIYVFDASTDASTSHICESWQAAGWTYEGYKRRPASVGDRTWQ